MSKHTPGPWVVHSSYPWIIKQDADVPFCEPDSGLTICNTMGHSNSGFFPTPEEGRANARLIAAAPDLLAQLKRCANVLAAEGLPLTAAPALAAIAKAEGEQQ